MRGPWRRAPPFPVFLDLPEVDHTFSNSELGDWKRCRRRWWLAWYRGLATLVDDRLGARATGDRIHRALAAWYVPTGQPQVDPRDALERVIVEDWTDIAHRAREANVDDYRLADLAKRFNDSTMLERVMIEGYWQWLQETGADAELAVLGGEQILVADLDVPVNPVDGTDVRRTRLVGKLDARFYRRSDGVRLFDDHKTTGDLKTVQATLHGDPQMLTYHVLEWLNTDEGEERCEGALYTMLKKVKRTDRATPPFFERVEVRHNPIELETWKRELVGAMRDVLRTVDQLDAGANHLDVAYRTWKSECRFDCDFFTICPMFNDGSRVEGAIATLYQPVNPLARYDSREVAAALGGSVNNAESKG